MQFNNNLISENIQLDVNILIVDDVLDNIQVAMSILKEDEYDLFYEAQGTDALALLENEQEKKVLI